MEIEKSYNLNGIRPDLKIIVELVTDNSTVLDLGCGTGELLELLDRMRHVEGRGIEIDEQAIYKCVEKGLSVFHDDIDTGLSEYDDKSFDYVILNQILQQVKHIEFVLQNALRVGQKVIVGLPNFAHIKTRSQLFFNGKAPITPALPYEWYSTPNLHFCSLSDFIGYCERHGIKILDKRFLSSNKKIRVLPNLLAETGIFTIKK